MPNEKRWLAVALLIAGLAASDRVSAQGLESFGTRGAAMAAFVAVADDATAVAWNPSGLVSGPFFNLTLQLGRSTDEPRTPQDSAKGAQRVGTTILALGTTPMGLAYYRIRSTSVENTSPAVLGTSDRQDSQVVVRTLVTNHLGATVQQSVGAYLTLGATLKLVRGSVGSARVPAESWEEAFGRAEMLDGQSSTRGDLDVGAMLAVGRVRVGAVVRNATAPTFGGEPTGGAARLERHVRVGAAWGEGWPGNSRTVVSFDADLTRVPHPSGERRDLAAGVEQWLRAWRVGLRGGLRASVLGDVRPVLSAGGSYAVRPGMYVDGYIARGTGDERAWGIAARVTY